MGMYTTAKYTGSEKLEYWNDCISRQFTHLEAIPHNNSFEASLKTKSFKAFSIANPVTTACRVMHTKEHIKRQNERVFLIHYQVSGSSKNFQNGRQAELNQGDFTICDSSRPYVVDFDDKIDMLVLRVEEEEFVSRFSNFNDFARKISGREGVGFMASNMINDIWNLENGLKENYISSRLSDSVLDVIAVACGHISSAKKESIRETRKQRVLSFIHLNLHDEALTLSKIAQANGISVGYLHKIFRDQSMSAEQYIIKKRLDWSKKLLKQNAETNGNLSITQIAFEVGFKNLSHFSKKFKSELGMTPTDYLVENGLLK